MEIILAIIAIVIAVMSENAKKQKKAATMIKDILEETANLQSQGRVNPSSAFENARQRATQNQRAQQRAQSEAAAGKPDPGRVATGTAFSQVRRQGVKAVFPKNDPGRVSAQSVAQTKKESQQQRKQQAQAAAFSGDPLMRPVVTRREKFERGSAYEHSNRMDVRYTSNGCGCSTGKGNASSGRAHGFSSATYDEARFFKESREICSGNWS